MFVFLKDCWVLFGGKRRKGGKKAIDVRYFMREKGLQGVHVQQ